MVTSGRRLAAILFTDMVGYSSLAQRNEALALELVRNSEQIVRPILSQHGGREVKATGDGVLAEFESALSATEAAIEIQRTIHNHNSQPGTTNIELRIGIHLGDVEHRGQDILGDSVNIASRIEALAEPGGACVTGAVFEQVQNRVQYEFQELEEVSLKNIAQKVAVYRLIFPWIERGESGLTPWTGRKRELPLVLHAIEQARRGGGQVLFVRGEAGIGKTRLVQEAVRWGSSGCRILNGRALPGEPCPPYDYWAQSVRGFVRESPPMLVLRVVGEWTSEIAKLVPELAHRLGPVLPPVAVLPDTERMQFYEGIASTFLNIAKEAPLIVIFDDLQWADTSTLRLLQFAARRFSGSRILILATVRDYDPNENPVLEEVIRDVTHEHLGRSMSLSRLPFEDVERIAEFILGSDRPAEQVSPLLFQKTGGNPYFVEEVLRNLIESGAIRGGGSTGPSALADLPFPETVRQVILMRLGRLNSKTVEVLRIASVIGAEFSFDVLQKASGEAEGPLLHALEEALQVRVLRERLAGRLQPIFAFSDEQIREVLYADLSLVRLQQYHRRVGAALESVATADQVEVVESMAHHFLQGNEPKKALTYIVQAGDRAAALSAPEQSVSRYRSAAQLLEKTPDLPLRYRVLESLGTQLGKLGEIDDQVRYWEEAAEGWERLGDGSKAGDLLRRLGILLVRTFGKPGPGKQRLERARALLEKGALRPELARLYLDYAEAEEADGRAAEAAVFLVKALDLIEDLDDLGLKAEFRLRRGTVAQFGDVGVVRRELEELLDYGVEHDPEVGLLAYWQIVSFAALGRGEFLEAREWVGKAVAFAEKTRNIRWAMVFKGVALPFLAITLGDVESARSSLQDFRDFLVAHRQPPDGRNLRLLGEIAMLRGELGSAQRLFEQAKGAGSPMQPWLSEVLLTLDLARLEVLEGEPRRAEERLTKSMPTVRSASLKGHSWFLEDWFLALLVEVTLRQNAPERAKPFLVELRNSTRDMGGDAARGLSLRAEGQYASASGDLKEGANALRQSVDAWRRSGWKIELARTQLDLAEVCRDLGEMKTAERLVEEAMQLFTQIQAQPDLDVALSLKRTFVGA